MLDFIQKRLILSGLPPLCYVNLFCTNVIEFLHCPFLTSQQLMKPKMAIPVCQLPCSWAASWLKFIPVLFLTASLLWAYILTAQASIIQPARIDQQISFCQPALKKIKDFALVCKNGSIRLTLIITAPSLLLLFLSWAKMYWVGCGVIKFQLATFV